LRWGGGGEEAQETMKDVLIDEKRW
jgi:hypothetical protein